MSTPLLTAPDVGAVFEYAMQGDAQPGTYRVTAWLREKPWSASVLDMATAGALPDEFGGMRRLFAACLVQRLEEEEEPSSKPRMTFCSRQFATHVAGYGVGGCIVPLERIKVVGTVDWPEADIARERELAEELGREGGLVV